MTTATTRMTLLAVKAEATHSPITAEGSSNSSSRVVSQAGFQVAGKSSTSSNNGDSLCIIVVEQHAMHRPLCTRHARASRYTSH